MSKPVLTMYRLGQAQDKGKSYNWGHGKQFQTFEELATRVALDLFGSSAVKKKAFDLQGNPITRLDQFVENERYVWCPITEAFNAQDIPKAALSTSVGAPVAEPNLDPQASGLDRLAAEAVEKNRAINVTFYRLGLIQDHGKEYVWNMSRQFKTFDQMITRLATDVQGPTGPVRNVFDMEGNQLSGLGDLVHNGKYLCGGPGDKYDKNQIPPYALGNHAHQKQSDQVKQQLPGYKDPTDGSKIVFLIGGKGLISASHRGARLVLKPNKITTMEQLIPEVRGKVLLSKGAVNALYEIESGKKITAVDQLEHDMKYLCLADGEFSKDLLPDWL